MVNNGRDRLREMLDAALGEDNPTLREMADDAHTSPFHFSRRVSRDVGEPPVALRRRVLLERSAWQLQRGSTVTHAAFAAGYESVEGFIRAFGRAFGHPPSGMPPSADGHGHWLPAPNGIHFHSPTVLYVSHREQIGGAAEDAAGDVTGLLLHHDVDDISILLAAATSLDAAEIERIRMPGHRTLTWDGFDESLADVLHHLVFATLPWIASIEGAEQPRLGARLDVPALIARHDEIAPRWLALTRDIARRDAWGDGIIDALCDPPESFLLSQIVAHVITFSAHRRQLARIMLAGAGVDTTEPHLDPDPIMWQRRLSGGR